MSKLNLGMAYDMKKRNAKKKMAKGGEADPGAVSWESSRPDKGYGAIIFKAEGGPVNAQAEKRASDSQVNNDATDVRQNLPDGSQIPRPKIEKLKGPSMVKSSIIQARIRDESDMVDNMPPKKYDGMSEDMGPSHDEYDAKRAAPMLAKGGMINEEVSMEDADNDNLDEPARLEDADNMRGPAQDEYMADHFAEGGSVEDGMDQPMDEENEERHASIADAIMAKRSRPMSLDSDSDDDKMVMMAAGGEVDLDLNAEEQPNSYYKRNEDAALKENYDSDMDDVSQPMDSNEHGDDREMDSENKMDMISAIRNKMISKRVQGKR